MDSAACTAACSSIFFSGRPRLPCRRTVRPMQRAAPALQLGQACARDGCTQTLPERLQSLSGAAKLLCKRLQGGCKSSCCAPVSLAGSLSWIRAAPLSKCAWLQWLEQFESQERWSKPAARGTQACTAEVLPAGDALIRPSAVVDGGRWGV